MIRQDPVQSTDKSMESTYNCINNRHYVHGGVIFFKAQSKAIYNFGAGKSVARSHRTCGFCLWVSE